MKLKKQLHTATSSMLPASQVLSVDESPSDRANLLKLTAGRLDVVLSIEESGRAVIVAEALTGIERSSVFLTSNYAYLAFSKTKSKKALLEKFNQAIAEMRQDGRLTELSPRNWPDRPARHAVNCRQHARRWIIVRHARTADVLNSFGAGAILSPRRLFESSSRNGAFMQFKDYYQILGVKREATAEDIKKAFRKLARKYHPDVSKEKDAEQRMQEINEAYTVLSDPERRAAYDQVGSGYQPGQDFRPPPDWDAGFEFSTHGFSPGDAAGFSDFFSQLFGGMGQHGMGGFRAHRGAGAYQARGEDHHAKVVLDIEDAFHGATRQISLRVPKLDAQGHVTLENRTLNVKIPVGVREGQVIRLAGQGAPGFNGGRQGPDARGAFPSARPPARRRARPAS